MDDSEKYDNPNPQIKANPLSKLFFLWLWPFFKYGYQHDLQLKDLYCTMKADSSEDWADEMERHWLVEVEKAKKLNMKPSLMVPIRKTFWKPYLVVSIISLFRAVMFTFFMPVFLAEFINTFSLVPHNTKKGWYWGGAVIITSFINCLLTHHTLLFSQRIGMRARVACSSLIYRKVLKLDRDSLEKTNAGKLANFLSNDANRLQMVSGLLHSIGIMPIQAAIGTYVMYSYVGAAAFAGIAAMIIQAVPIQGTLSKMQGKLRFKIASKTDNRMKLMSEIISGIKVIKMYAWEKPFEKSVALLRKFEIKELTKSIYIRGISVSFMVFSEKIALYVLVIVYVLMGNQLTGSIVFSMSQVINTLQAYVCIMFPMALATYAETKTSIFRIEEFLMMAEMEEVQKQNLSTPGLVKLEHVVASWSPKSVSDTLVDISFELKPGSLCCIIGSVGSGKTSLIHLLLRELTLRSGKMEVGGSVSYAAQEPWLFKSNIRNNILFGQPYNKEKYDKVIAISALQKDFELFPFGDKTIVGEKGVSLSGGQRARINLARAVYRDADIYLFDDPLSAVDPQVANHLFEKCILQSLSEKTRILVTHQTKFLDQADYVLFLNNGKVQKFTKPLDLSSNDLSTIQQTSNSEKPALDTPEERRPSCLKSLSLEKKEHSQPKETQELIERGSIKFSVYEDYYRADTGVAFLILEIIVFIVAQTVSNSCDLWVTFWTNNVVKMNTNLNRTVDTTNTSENITSSSSEWGNTTSDQSNLVKVLGDGIISNEITNMRTNIYIQVYTMLIILSIIFTISRSILFFKICIRASTSLHNSMFSNILQTTMRFFETNPSGRILNRFSKDMGAVDESIPITCLLAMQLFLLAGGILLVTFIKSYWLIAPAILLGSMLYWFRKMFMKGAQDLRRLEGTTKAPLFTYITASLDGLSTIRSADAETLVKREFDTLQDQNTSASYLSIVGFVAFGFYLDIITTLFIITATVHFLLDENALEGDVGLVMSQSLVIIRMLQFGIRHTAVLASTMISVERVLQYTKLEKEDPSQSLPTYKPPRDWPEAGRIIFKNVYLRYATDEEPVLKNLNFEIHPSEKIGVVGRTGAGKSSVISALFRLAPTDGTIQIDGVDISKLGLKELRTKVSIIPQEPTFFSENIRYNLDPFGKYSDETLWQALDSVELKEVVESLNMEVSEGGSNFSAGQRQLICLARAIVRNNRILIMDEATANVDPKTDALIQKTMKNHFKHCTILTVAHRLNTIMDSDRVMVMDAGEIREFASPYVLLQNTEGYFSKMVSQTGPEMEASLRKIAAEHFKGKKQD